MFKRDFMCPALLFHRHTLINFNYGSLTLFALPSHAICLSIFMFVYTRVPLLSLVTTNRIAYLLSFPHPTKIFQSGWCRL